MMYFFVFILFAAAILLMLIVLIQAPKTGGLNYGMSSTQRFLGVKNTLDFLEKGTWIFAGIILVGSILFNVFFSETHVQSGGESLLQEEINKTNNSFSVPQKPAEEQPQGIIDPTKAPQQK